MVSTRIVVPFARLRPLLPWFAIVGAAALFFLPALVEGTTFYAFDIYGDYWPWRGDGRFPSPRNPVLTDPVVGLYPPTFYLGHLHYQAALARGGLEFWEPAILGGQPYQHYLSPISYLLFSLLPLTVAHDAFLFAGLCCVGVFTYLFLRSVGVATLASTFGAVAFTFNGYLMVWFEFEHILALSAALAGALYFVERMLAVRTWSFALALALCLGAGIAIAHPQQSLYLAGFVVCYFAYRVWTGRRNGERGEAMRAWLRLFGLALAVTAVLSLGYLLANLDQIQGSNRPPIPFSRLASQTGALPLSYLVTLLFPDFFGNPILGWATTPKPHPPQPYNNYCELCIYAGIPTLLLALTGLMHWRKRGLPRFFGAVALLCLLFAGATVLYYPIAVLLPGMSLSSPCRILFLFGFALACLAAFSLDRLLAEASPRERLWRLAVPVAMALLVAAIAIVLALPDGPVWLWRYATGEGGARYPERAKEHFAFGGSAFAIPLPLMVSSLVLLAGLALARTARRRLLLAGALLALLGTDLTIFGWRFNTRSPRSHAYPSTGAIAFLQKDQGKFRAITLSPFFLHNSLLAYGIEDAGGYQSFYPRAYGEYWFLSQHGQSAIPQTFSKWCGFRTVGSPLLDALNVKYFITPRPAGLPEDHFRLAYDGDAYVYENLRAFPRAFLVRDAVVLPEAAARLAKLRGIHREDLARVVILEKAVRPAPKAAAANMPPADVGKAPRPVTLARYQSDAIELRVDDPLGGFVVVGDNYHPGWRAWLDAQQVEILRANHIMRAVQVPAGSHTIRMEFSARAQVAGLLVSNLGWLAVGAVLSVAAIRRKRLATPQR
ncbi:MAG: hypothetical protein JXP73_20635 [Deltaproteobacteria bacterium]|nr:hypothetical protein [Deltaproteobacteria bacterium]